MSIRSHWRSFRGRLVPGPRGWAGARRGVLLVAAAIFVASVLPVFDVPSFNWTALIPMLLLPLTAFLAGGLIVLLRGLLSSFPRSFFWAAASTVVAFAFLLGFAGPRGLPVFSLYAILAGALTGGGLASLLGPRGERPTGLDRVVSVSSLAVGVVLLALGVVWLAWDGPAEKPIADAGRSSTAVIPLALPDPAEPGPHVVRELTYGSGSDSHRPEFGEKATLRTRSVDGSLLLERWKGALGWARTAYWGFDAKHLPLQGRVWYPEGGGPFPIVLVVHGNHLAEDFSDAGYEYLGRLLASRGTIAVSVDENFLNSTVSDALGFPQGWSEENDARGWLLLEHLRQWREWSRTPGSPFEGRVDLERVGLVGHSRGGEAVAVAGVTAPTTGSSTRRGDAATRAASGTASSTSGRSCRRRTRSGSPASSSPPSSSRRCAARTATARSSATTAAGRRGCPSSSACSSTRTPPPASSPPTTRTST